MDDVALLYKWALWHLAVWGWEKLSGHVFVPCPLRRTFDWCQHHVPEQPPQRGVGVEGAPNKLFSISDGLGQTVITTGNRAGPGTMWCFDMCTHCGTILPRLLLYSSPYICCVFFITRTIKIYSFSDFEIQNIFSLTLVIILCLENILLSGWNFRQFLPFPNPSIWYPIPCPHFILFNSEFEIFRIIIPNKFSGNPAAAWLVPSSIFESPWEICTT